MDYKDSIQLPKTDFPMKANLAQREPEILKAWEADRIFAQVVARNAARPGANAKLSKQAKFQELKMKR